MSPDVVEHDPEPVELTRSAAIWVVPVSEAEIRQPETSVWDGSDRDAGGFTRRTRWWEYT
jgi:hypothetical protein